jgi:hypothetical protein
VKDVAIQVSPSWTRDVQTAVVDPEPIDIDFNQLDSDHVE